MMKNFKLLLIVLCLSLGMAANGWAIKIEGGTYDGTDVGDLDTFIEFGPQQGSPGKETAWVNDILDPDTFLQEKLEEDIPYYATDTLGVYAIELPDPFVSDYFLIKNATYVALFENNPALDWGVFSVENLPDGMNIPTEDLTVSHVTRFGGSGGGGGGGGTPVPEPATMLLLGTGLVVLAAGARRKMKKS